MTATQRSRLSFLKLVVLGTLLVPLLAVSGGAAVFGGTPAADQSFLPAAPPSFVLVLLGLSLVAWAVGRRYLKAARG